MSARAQAILSLWLVVAAPLACERPQAATPKPDREADRLDVMEAVFRHQFDDFTGPRARSDYVFLLVVSGQTKADPPAEVMKRLTPSLKVLPASLATTGRDGRVTHKDLGGHGVILGIGSIKWITKDLAEVGGGFHEAPPSGSGNTYRVERRGGKWVVTKGTDEIIS